MADKLTVPGELVDKVRLRMYQKKCTYAQAAEEILKENPQAAKTEKVTE